MANKKYVAQEEFQQSREEFHEFRDNHFYHLSMKVAGISGQVKVLLGLTITIVALVIGMSFV